MTDLHFGWIWEDEMRVFENPFHSFFLKILKDLWRRGIISNHTPQPIFTLHIFINFYLTNDIQFQLFIVFVLRIFFHPTFCIIFQLSSLSSLMKNSVKRKNFVVYHEASFINYGKRERETLFDINLDINLHFNYGESFWNFHFFLFSYFFFK